jgi:hypothetical protein
VRPPALRRISVALAGMMLSPRSGPQCTGARGSWQGALFFHSPFISTSLFSLSIERYDGLVCEDRAADVAG